MNAVARYVRDSFRTQVRPYKTGLPDLRHTDRILMLGSCFTDEVGLRLTADMFDVVHNPFGEQYNPLSVAYALQRILDRRSFSVDELVRDDSGVWHSWWLHSRFSSTDASRLLSRANDALELAGALATKSDNSGRLWIMVTFGTAFCYSLVGDSGENTVVANCHKFRPSLFECKRLDVEDIVGIWMPLLDGLQSVFPEISVIFTVSPVRYLSYGPQGNSLSKSILHLAVERLCKHPVASYFPAYEILMDDLRDYRFYASDMVHPSGDGADYVYAGLLGMLCDDKTLDLAKRCRNLRNRFEHRPLTDNPEAYARFRQDSIEEVEKLIQSHPELESRWHRFLNEEVTNDI